MRCHVSGREETEPQPLNPKMVKAEEPDGWEPPSLAEDVKARNGPRIRPLGKRPVEDLRVKKRTCYRVKNIYAVRMSLLKRIGCSNALSLGADTHFAEV